VRQNGHPGAIPSAFREEEQARPHSPVDDFVTRENSRQEPAFDIPIQEAPLPVPAPVEQAPFSPEPAHEELTHDDYHDEEHHEPAVEPSIAPPTTIGRDYETAISQPVRPDPNAELLAKFHAAQAEIERLRATITTMSEAPQSEVRYRGRAFSDAGSTTAETDVATMIDDSRYPPPQDGVPLQVVVIIALGVFITTYLFF
jgi:vesicle-associated membrane protein-associated protein A